MGCGDTCLRVISGIFQAAFAIAGLGMVAYGSLTAYTILVTNSDRAMKEYGTLIPSVLLIVFGILLVISVFLGCCGICRESTCCMESFSSLLIILALAQLAFGAYCVIAYGSLEYVANLGIQIKLDIASMVENYKLHPSKLDQIQRLVSCCGDEEPFKEFGNYYTVGSLPNGSELPLSCCEGNVITCNGSNMGRREGCSRTVYALTLGSNILIGWISLVVGGAELIAALLGICLSCCVWRKQMGTWR